MKKIFNVLLSLCLAFSLFGCSSSNNDQPVVESKPKDLSGVWVDDNEDPTVICLIDDQEIEVLFVIDDDLYNYWYGSYEAPSEGKDGKYTWISQVDEDNCYGILASQDETKEFTYAKDTLTFDGIIDGTPMTFKVKYVMSIDEFNETLETEDEEEQSLDDLIEDIEIVDEYTLESGYGSVSHFYIVLNNSDYDLEVDTNTKAYDANNKLVSVADGEINVFGPGCYGLIHEYFDTSESVQSFDTKWTVKESKYYNSVIEDIEIEDTPIEDGVIVSLTNSGKKPAEFVMAYLLCYKNDELVDYDWTYFTDDDSELKPGDEISNQFKIYEDFDEYEIFITGRREK